MPSNRTLCCFLSASSTVIVSPSVTPTTVPTILFHAGLAPVAGGLQTLHGASHPGWCGRSPGKHEASASSSQQLRDRFAVLEQRYRPIAGMGVLHFGVDAQHVK